MRKLKTFIRQLKCKHNNLHEETHTDYQLNDDIPVSTFVVCYCPDCKRRWIKRIDWRNIEK